MLRKIIAFALVFALAAPMGFVGEAAAATAYNTLPSEPKFTNNIAVTTGVPTDPSYTVSGFNPQKYSGSYAAWSYAAIAVLNHKAGVGKSFDITKMSASASTNAATNGNRSSLSAYLMDVERNGPVDSALDPPLRTPVSGVVYIPDSDNRQDLVDRIKIALKTNSAVAASLHYNANSFYINTANSSEYLYHSTAPSSANHTVVIIGWNDAIGAGTYELVSNQETKITRTNPGAFRVHDANNGDYWVSYDTLLSGAYYIEEFYDNNGSNAAHFEVTSPRDYTEKSKNPKNPLATTYQYDNSALNNVIGTSTKTTISSVEMRTAVFANVFNVKDGATALHAISVFLTGENNIVNIYLIDGYTDEKDLDDYDNPIKNEKSKRIATESKSLPGYYTIPILGKHSAKTGVKLENNRFAIVAEVAYDNSMSNPGVPVSSSPSSNSYMLNGSTWSKTTYAVCLKAHGERDVDIDLTSVSIPATKDTDGKDEIDTTSGFNLVKVAPGRTQSIGPTLHPANANNMLTAENKWILKSTDGTSSLEYYVRDTEGWLDTTKNKDGTYELKTATAAELHWNSNLGLFVPANLTDIKQPTNSSTKWAANRTKDGSSRPTVSAYKVQPVELVNALSSNVSVKVSSDTDFYGNEYILELRASKGEKDNLNGDWKKKGGTGTDKDDPASTQLSQPATAVIKIDAGSVDRVELSKENISMKAGTSTTLGVRMLDDKDKVLPLHKVEWFVFADSTWRVGTDGITPVTGFDPYDPRDPYSDDGPSALIDQNGKITALKDDTVYVFARAGGKVSAFCEVVIEERAPTGVSLNKKKMTMTAGTTLTLTASVKPSAASNKGVSWAVESETPVKDGDKVVEIDPRTGIIEAQEPGKAIVTVTTSAGDYSAQCEITVTTAPTIIRSGKSATLSVLGAASNAKVEWRFLDKDGNVIEDDDKDPVLKSKDEKLTGSRSGTRCKVTASKPDGAVTVQASVVVELDEPIIENGATLESVTIREQSWEIRSVTAISKMSYVADENKKTGSALTKADFITKETLSVRPDGTDGQELTLRVEVTKPFDGTLLDFDWTQKVKKNSDPIVDIIEVNSNTITIKALSPGTTRVTGTNHNGNKKVSISIKVLLYPTLDQIRLPKAVSMEGGIPTLEIVHGKKGNIKAKVEGKNVNKTLEYDYVGTASQYITLEKDNKGKFNGRIITRKLTGDADVRVVVKAPGPNKTPITQEIRIIVKEKQKK
ncbi:MAG: Ig-like domain-containing protein [Oscillospiraceae bacterium]|jgi:uncharacterized protein YjdB|nr:Ig-like domain-containing protein [Oscillospiraceae bacterium]